MIPWIRDNPQFAAVTFVVLVLTIVMTVLVVAMSRAGASLRPIVWFFGFFAIVAGPQAVVHLLDGFVVRKERALQAATPANAAEKAPRTNGLAPVEWERVFGPNADPALITDAKRGLSMVLDDATEAKLSFHRDGASALAARFPNAAAAARAVDRYGTFFAFTRASGSDAEGWTARRHGGQGEWVHVVSAGPELYAWTAADKAAVIAHRERVLGNLSSGAAGEGPKTEDFSSQLVSTRLRAQVGLMVGIISLNLIVAGVWFFKGSAWAARVNGSQAALPASAESIKQQLVTMNRQDVPMSVTAQPDGSIEVTWRYADARWFDLMRLHQLKRTQRIVLHFDETARKVRVREYWSAFDASMDFRSQRLDWKLATGIQFFAVEHRRVFGVQLGADGKPTGELSKAYTFNLQELKAPIIDVVTRAGWHWQPVTWNAPTALRWLTE